MKSNEIKNTLNEFYNIDWVTVTFSHLKDIADVSMVIQQIGKFEDYFTQTVHGMRGYQTHFAIENIKLSVIGNAYSEHMGACLDMSGSGCRLFEKLSIQIGIENPWIEFFKICLKNGGRFTRIDIAHDEFAFDIDTPLSYSIETMDKYTRNGQLRSPLRSGKNIESRNLSNGKGTGQTLTYGSRASNLVIRFYDKLLESIANGSTYNQNIVKWNRGELEFRRDKAHLIVSTIIKEEGINNVFKGVMKEHLTFLEQGKDSNKSRWNTAKWWSDYICDINPIKLTIIPKTESLERKKKYLMECRFSKNY